MSIRCSMELFSQIGVTGLPDNFHIQQKDKLFLYGNLFNFIKKTIFLLKGEVNRQASDSCLTK